MVGVLREGTARGGKGDRRSLPKFPRPSLLPNTDRTRAPGRIMGREGRHGDTEEGRKEGSLACGAPRGNRLDSIQVQAVQPPRYQPCVSVTTRAPSCGRYSSSHPAQALYRQQHDRLDSSLRDGTEFHIIRISYGTRHILDPDLKRYGGERYGRAMSEPSIEVLWGCYDRRAKHWHSRSERHGDAAPTRWW